MNNQEAIKTLRELCRETNDSWYEEVYDKAIYALQAQEAPDINVGDMISRQESIDTNCLDEEIRCAMCRNQMKTDRGCDGNCKYDEKLYEKIMQILDERIKPFPPAQPDGEYISRQAVTESDLIDWYINSVDESEPVWTEEHVYELFNDFYLIPKEN